MWFGPIIRTHSRDSGPAALGATWSGKKPVAGILVKAPALSGVQNELEGHAGLEDPFQKVDQQPVSSDLLLDIVAAVAFVLELHVLKVDPFPVA